MLWHYSVELLLLAAFCICTQAQAALSAAVIESLCLQYIAKLRACVCTTTNVAVSEASTTCYHVHAIATEIEIVDLPALLMWH